MRLFYWRHWSNNFGDEINAWLWDRLLPGRFADGGADGTLFVGIGTLLSPLMPFYPRTLVFGSGAGYGEPPERLRRSEIVCVRGPMTASRLGLPDSAAVCDPAILVAPLIGAAKSPGQGTVFMPHWMNDNPGWAPVCARLGYRYISPSRPVEEILAELRAAELVLTEAMHGAVVADALGVPWVGVKIPGGDRNSFKWEDWSRSLELQPERIELPPVPQPEQTVASIPRLAGAAFERPDLSSGENFDWAVRGLADAAQRGKPSLSNRRLLSERTEELQRRLAKL